VFRLLSSPKSGLVHYDPVTLVLQDGAKRGELVGEYTGELVTQAEADRRGKAYDRDDNSYLFNLNEEWVIDARRRGNKLRFANHRYCMHNFPQSCLPATCQQSC
jgi:SET domain-containing protein